MQTTRHTCRTAAQPSRASPVPTKGGVVWLPGTCGSWLASDADNSAYLPDRGTAIAGKPDSYKEWNGVVPRYLWELARQRCRQLGIPAGLRCCHRGQARLPQRVAWCGSPGPVGAGLPAMQTTRHTCRSAVQPSRASPTPTKAGMVWFPGTCGSWLASDADNSTCLPDRGAAIAGKPDSHKGWSGVAPRYLWELACQRCRQLDIPAGPRHCHRGQARLSHKGDLWELACQRCRQLDMPAGPRCSYRGQARLPQKVIGVGCCLRGI